MSGVDHWTCQEHYDVFLMLNNSITEIIVGRGHIIHILQKSKIIE